MANEKIVCFDSPEAASIQTVTGWVDRHGVFWGDDERQARWCGCTHMPCVECGVQIERGPGRCEKCQEKFAFSQWLNMPEGDWNGSDMLYSERDDKWFPYIEDLDFHLDQSAKTFAQLGDFLALRLVIGRPVYAHERDPRETYQDDLPEDTDIPQEIEEAFNILNKSIKAYKHPLCWEPGEFRPTEKSIRTLLDKFNKTGEQ